MITVTITDYWQGIVNYFYSNIQPNNPELSIWKWLKKDFDCNGSMNSSVLRFNNDQGYTAFRLTIPKKQLT